MNEIGSEIGGDQYKMMENEELLSTDLSVVETPKINCYL